MSFVCWAGVVRHLRRPGPACAAARRGLLLLLPGLLQAGGGQGVHLRDQQPRYPALSPPRTLLYCTADCRVDRITRNNCRACRLARCLQAGMLPGSVDSRHPSQDTAPPFATPPDPSPKPRPPSYAILPDPSATPRPPSFASPTDPSNTPRLSNPETPLPAPVSTTITREEKLRIEHLVFINDRVFKVSI